MREKIGRKHETDSSGIRYQTNGSATSQWPTICHVGFPLSIYFLSNLAVLSVVFSFSKKIGSPD